MHVEIYMENWKDLVNFATLAKMQIFMERMGPDGNRLWFASSMDGSANGVVTVFMAAIATKDLDVLNEVGAVPYGKVIPASIEVIHE
jgi:hypothetical protein